MNNLKTDDIIYVAVSIYVLKYIALRMQLTEEASTICTNLRASARVICGEQQFDANTGVQLFEKGTC